MKDKISKTMRALLLVPVMALAMGFVVMPVSDVSAKTKDSSTDCPSDISSSSNLDPRSGANCAKSDSQNASLFAPGGIFQTITNVLLFIIGAVAVIMLIIGGIRYTISGGDSAQVTAAKNTILYAIVGIVVALLAFAVVNFVLTSFAA